jgi:antitoxin (DNA-binding transcriptional repressor) of toxin-antitoxin stability system
MQTIQATEFKARCLALMDEVAKTGESILITKHGKPIAELKAHQPPRAKSLLGLDRGKIEILGDIIAPAYDGEWDALK